MLDEMRIVAGHRNTAVRQNNNTNRTWAKWFSPRRLQTRSTTEATLYQVVQEHLETLLAQVEAETVAGLRELVKAEGIESDCAREKGGARCIVAV
jgi:hypothetical protein